MLEFLTFDIFNILNLIGHASLFANWEHHPYDGAKYDGALKNLYFSCFIRKSTFLCVFSMVLWDWREFQRFIIVFETSYGVLSGVCPVFFDILNAFPSFVSTNS